MESELESLSNSERKNKYWEIVREYDRLILDVPEEHVEYFTGTYLAMLKRCDELDNEEGTCAAYGINPLTKERI